MPFSSTTPLTEHEELTLRKSRWPIECFVSNGLFVDCTLRTETSNRCVCPRVSSTEPFFCPGSESSVTRRKSAGFPLFVSKPAPAVQPAKPSTPASANSASLLLEEERGPFCMDNLLRGSICVVQDCLDEETAYGLAKKWMDGAGFARNCRADLASPVTKYNCECAAVERCTGLKISLVAIGNEDHIDRRLYDVVICY